MELYHGLARRDARAGDDGLAGVVALGGAVPEEEAVVEGWQVGRRPGVVSWDVRSSTITRPGREGGKLSRIGVCSFPGLQFSCLHTWGTQQPRSAFRLAASPFFLLDRKHPRQCINHEPQHILGTLAGDRPRTPRRWC